MRIPTIGMVLAAALATNCAMAESSARPVDATADVSNIPQRLIVRYGDVGKRDMGLEARRMSSKSGRPLRFVRSLSAPGHHLLQIEGRMARSDMDALKASLVRSPDLELVEEDLLVSRHFTPNDTFYPNQWHYYEGPGGINLPPAWDQQTGLNTVVAVLDTGYTEHSDLVSNILPGYDFVSDFFIANDGDGRDADARDPGDWLESWDCGVLNPPQPQPSSWHGTHTAGTVAAVTNNSRGVAGVAFDAKVVPVRVLGKCGGFISDIAEAIVWAAGGAVAGVPVNPNPAQVINLSLGTTGPCGSAMQWAVNTARAAGATVVASAGNGAVNAGGTTPANCDGVISVAANDRQGNRAVYSNFGAVDVTAPGGEAGTNGVASTLNDGSTTPGDDIYVYYTGTSMAASHVSGAAALLYAADANIRPDEVHLALVETARPLPGNCSGGCGAGIIDADRAIDYVNAGPINPPSASQVHADLAEQLFDLNPPVPSPSLAGAPGWGYVTEAMEQRGYWALVLWLPQRGGRCVRFWPSAYLECLPAPLGLQLGRAALEALVEGSSGPGAVTPPTGLEDQIHAGLVEDLFDFNPPLIQSPQLALPAGTGYVADAMADPPSYWLLVTWRPELGGRCVQFWPDEALDCDPGPLATQIGRAALAVLD